MEKTQTYLNSDQNDLKREHEEGSLSQQQVGALALVKNRPK